MEEKYITRLLTFSNEVLMGNYKTISLNRKNVKELLKEIHKDCDLYEKEEGTDEH